MELAVIVPPKYFDTFISKEDSYVMVVAPWLGEERTYFERIRRAISYNKVTGRPRSCHLMLDNETFERVREPPDKVFLTNCAVDLGVLEVVLPDILGDPEETLRLSREMLQSLVNSEWAGSSVMFVPQARTPEDWKRCLDEWEVFWGRHCFGELYDLVIGLSSLRREKGLLPQVGSRRGLIEEVARRGYRSHLLGIASVREFYEEELPLAERHRVRGVDTTLPFALGASGSTFGPRASKKFLGDLNQYESLSKQQVRTILFNIAVLRSWCEGGE